MAKTYLGGNGPEEEEQRTEAQINDARLPSSMTMSERIMNAADDDETPAIERRINHAGLVSISEHIGERKLDADPEFETAELKRRELEKEQKEKTKQAEAKQTKDTKPTKEVENKKSAKQSTSKSDCAKAKDFDFNSLYPNAKKIDDNSELPKAGRAKIDEIAEDQSIRLLTSIVLQLASFVAFILSALPLIPKYLGFINVMLYIASAIFMVASAVILFYDLKNKVFVKYPYSQRKQFVYTTIVPFLVFRIVAIIVINALLPKLFYNLQLTVAAVGVPIVSYYQYMLLQKNKISYSQKLTAINTGVIVILIIIFVILTAKDGVFPIFTSILDVGILAIVFYLFDRFAGKMTKTLVV